MTRNEIMSNWNPFLHFINYCIIIKSSDPRFESGQKRALKRDESTRLSKCTVHSLLSKTRWSFIG